jgi:Na+-driven multidrug efflux pump
MSQVDVGCFGNIKRVPKTIHLVTFMIPTFGMYLANPILSLCDTAYVGLYGDAVELAALGPGCALCDMMCYFANFLAVATTSLLASAIARNDMVLCC